MSKITIELELGARPSEREIEGVNILVTNKIPKRQVVFLRPNRTKGAKTPDITIDGLPWEIKSIEKLGKYTLDHAERAGLRQADNLIFDLRQLKISLQEKTIREIQKEYLKRKTWKGLVVIIRPDDKCLTFSK